MAIHLEQSLEICSQQKKKNNCPDPAAIGTSVSHMRERRSQSTAMPPAVLHIIWYFVLLLACRGSSVEKKDAEMVIRFTCYVGKKQAPGDSYQQDKTQEMSLYTHNLYCQYMKGKNVITGRLVTQQQYGPQSMWHVKEMSLNVNFEGTRPTLKNTGLCRTNIACLICI